MTVNYTEELQKLKTLYDENIISEYEYSDLKKFILDTHVVLDKKTVSENVNSNKVTDKFSVKNIEEKSNSVNENNVSGTRQKSTQINTTTKNNSSKTIILVITLLIVILSSGVVLFYQIKNSEEKEQIILQEREKIKQDSITSVLNQLKQIEQEKEDSLASIEANKTDSINKVNQAYDLISNYYLSLNQPDFDANNWFDENVSVYITKSNITPTEINELHRENQEFTNPNSNILKETFAFQKTDGGVNYCRFENKFVCFRTSKNKYQSCRVLVEIGINNSSKKIASYRELKVMDLIFSDKNPIEVLK